MDDLQELQQKAQALDEQGDPSAALDTYLRLLDLTPPPSAAGLWLRVGGIQQSLGETAAALDSYQRALDGFAAAELDNLALVAVQRLLRADPDRAESYLRFGQICAARGYRRDARHGFLEYAERAASSGDADRAVRALQDYLRRFPDDSAVRRRVAELGGSTEAPSTVQSEPLPLELLSGFDAPSQDAEPASPADTAPGESPAADSEPEVLRLEGFEPTHAEVEWSRDAASAPELPRLVDDLPLEPTMAGVEEAETLLSPPAGPDGESADELPLLDFGEPGPDDSDHAVPALPELQPHQGWEPFSGDDDEDELPELGAGAGLTAPAEAEPLPELAPAPVDPSARLRRRLELDADDLQAHRELVALLDASGATAALAEALEQALAAFERTDLTSEAMDAARRLAVLWPGNVARLRRWAELAARAQDPLAEVAAQLALAHAHEAALDRASASAAYRRALELDPGNAEARTGLAALTPAAAPPPADYVDLGALILSDEPEPDATRFQVDAEQPSGDEQQDFEEILSLFRQKVAESIDPKDAASHYDLGLAFKEMGLLDDAIAQLQRALRGGANPLATLEVLGECFLEKGENALAARVLDRATRLHNAAEADLVGVYYWLGCSQQSLGELAQARGCFERVIAVDIGFRDAAARLQALRAG